jgi:Zn-dependent protease
MTRWSLTLERFFGIPIALDFPWLLVFALLTWSLAAGYDPAEFPHWSLSLYWLTGAYAAVLLFFSVLLHELGHSVVAPRFDVPVRG